MAQSKKIVDDMLKKDLNMSDTEIQTLMLGDTVHRGRKVKYLKDDGLVQVSFDNFIDWVQSVEYLFNMNSDLGRKRFKKWVAGELT